MGERELIITQDGSHSLLSHEHGVSYHSKYGAIQESRHVFIQHGLHSVVALHPKLSILEIGMGTGLNVFLTFLEAEQNAWEVYYESLEAFPIPMEEVKQLNYPGLLGVPEKRDQFLEIHQSNWNEQVRLSPHFLFQKRKVLFEDFQSEERFHLIYFDAFAPNAQPELWEEPVMKAMYKALYPGGVLTTYCAKGAFKRTAKGVGFQIESPPGPPGKREMTRCIKPIEG